MCLMSYANNKGADQTALLRSLISAFVVRCLDSIISLDSIAKISRLQLASVTVQAGLCLAWSKTPEDTFCHVVDINIFAYSSGSIQTSGIAFDSRGNMYRRDELPEDTGRNEEKEDTMSSDIRLRQRQNVAASENNSAIKENEAKNRQPVRNTVKISPLKQTVVTENSEAADESLNVSRSTSEAKMMLKHFEFLRIVLCFMVGFLCRKVLSSGYGVFYAQVRKMFST